MKRSAVTPTSQSTITLTDVDAGTWVDEFRMTAADGPELAGSTDWSISKRTLRGGPSDGVDLVELDNGCLSMTIVPTRGMGIWHAQRGDVRLGWDSPVTRPVHPSLVNAVDRGGVGWLTGFNELVCRCGLASHGAPGPDVLANNEGTPVETPLTLHGRIANIPAHFVELGVSTDGPGRLFVTGMVDETMLFGPCLRLTTTISTLAGSNRLVIDDEITNLAGTAAEFELLYHTNLGPPILEEGSRLIAPHRRVTPRDARAASDIGSFDRFSGPLAGYVEQCYFLELVGDEDGRTSLLLQNAAGNAGVTLEFELAELPCFTLWKNTQATADGYVTGLEPGTDLPNPRSFERAAGRLKRLEPGESWRTTLELAALDGAEEVSAAAERVAAIAGNLTPRVDAEPQDDVCPAD